MITQDQAKDLVTFLFKSGVESFEGFGLKVVFKAAATANPFELEDPAERRRAILENFKAGTKPQDQEDLDLFYSAP